MSPRTPEKRREYYLANKDKWKISNQKRYSEKKEELLEYQKVYREANRERITQRDREKIQKRRLDAIARLGGKCNMCGNSFPSYVYDFHHKDPTQKDFTIGENMGVAFDRFYAEVDKCELLCSNCHRIKHYKIKEENGKE